MSVSTPDARFGQAIQSDPSRSSFATRPSKRR